MDDWELRARIEITDMLSRYTRFGDGGRSADLARLFGSDGVLSVAGGQLWFLSLVNRLGDTASGAHGIVCGGKEAAAVRDKFGSQLAVLIPGVRPAGTDGQDQARVVTPSQAVKAGATYLVLGRAVTAVADPAVAMDQIDAEVALAAR